MLLPPSTVVQNRTTQSNRGSIDKVKKQREHRPCVSKMRARMNERIRSPFVGKKFSPAPTGNRTQGKCLEGIYVTTTPSALVRQSWFVNY